MTLIIIFLSMYKITFKISIFFLKCFFFSSLSWFFIHIFTFVAPLLFLRFHGVILHPPFSMKNVLTVMPDLPSKM
eukprot:UN02428